MQCIINIHAVYQPRARFCCNGLTSEVESVSNELAQRSAMFACLARAARSTEVHVYMDALPPPPMTEVTEQCTWPLASDGTKMKSYSYVTGVSGGLMLDEYSDYS